MRGWRISATIRSSSSRSTTCGLLRTASRHISRRSSRTRCRDELAQLEARRSRGRDAVDEAKCARSARNWRRPGADLEKWTRGNFAKLPPRAAEHSIARRSRPTRAIRITANWPKSRYQDGGAERRMQVPKGDVFHQFREDVRTGKLPTVSWIVAPENFSDHPGAPWYGAWYVSRGARHPHAESRGLEEDDLHPLLRRERRLLRSCAAVRRAASGPARNGQGLGRDRHFGRARRASSRRSAHGRVGPDEPRRADRPGLPRAAGHRVAVEPRRLRLLAGVRPHVDPAVPGEIPHATRPAGRFARRTSARGGGPSAAI